MKKITLLLLTCFFSTITFAQVVINEIDADQTGTDTGEFIELKSDTPNFSLDGYIVVLYNGSNDQSYAAFDLDGESTDANGFFLLANDGFTGMDISLGADNGLQNGADAVALYQANDTDFPNGTSVTATNLVDAIVYGTDDADDAELLTGLNETVQYNENMNGNKDTESIQRGADGFCVGAPTPKQANIDCSGACALSVYVVSVECDNITENNDTYTVTLGFEGGSTETYTITSTEGTVGGDNPSAMETGEITITGVTEGINFDYTIVSTNCNISNTITAPVCEPASNVATIGELRQGTVGLTYTLTGDAVITFLRETRNQKYIEDATGAVLVDDPDGIITGDYAIGDAINNISGELVDYNGVLEFVPTQDITGAISTGNDVTPQIITVDEYVTNYENYESELIAFEGVTISDAEGGDGTFQAATNYTFSNNSGSSELRTAFNDADYIGTTIPGNAVNLIGIGAEFNGNAQVYPRNSADIDATFANETFSQNDFSIYPNPASNGYVTIKMANETDAYLTIYNLLGKQVINQKVTGNAINIGNLPSGIYLVKVSQEGKSITKKLVIK